MTRWTRAIETGPSPASHCVHRDFRDALQPQDGLYSLTERDQTGAHRRVIGSVRQVLVARESPEAVIAAMTSPHVHIVTFTITEKGYLRDAASGALLIGSTDLAHDLAGAGAPRTIYGFLERAFEHRRAAGMPGITLVSCDNLANGGQLARLLHAHLELRDASLAQWARQEIRCPCTSNGRSTPSTSMPWVSDDPALTDSN